MNADKQLTRRDLLHSGTAITAGMVGLSDLVSASPSYGGGRNKIAGVGKRRSANRYAQEVRILLEVLQSRWFHAQPFARWGNEQNPWNTYNTLEAIVDYTQATQDNRYLDIIHRVVNDQELLNNVRHAGVDDEGWAAIALIKAHRLTKEGNGLAAARAIFTNMTGFWDDTCAGGVWWNFAKTYKNAITNELFLRLATLLYHETGESRYLNWAAREWHWFAGSGMINNEDLVNDGLRGCRNNGETTWTYNQGVLLGGLTDLYRITQEKSYLDQACTIASAVLRHLTRIQDHQRILNEPAGNLNADQQQFKGIFMRYLAYLTLHLPKAYARQRQTFQAFVIANADAVWKRARNRDNIINAYWVDAGSPPIYNAISQSSGVDLVNAALVLSL